MTTPMRTHTVELDTRQDVITDVTGSLRDFAAQARGDGLLHAFLPHATCGLAVVEIGAGSEADLRTAVHSMLPRDDRWAHSHGSPGHGADHVLPAFISPSLCIPVDFGELYLGTWQSVVVVDTNADNPTRTLRLSFISA
ncbi:MAG: YjbQ family protein [Euzebya sp.]